MNSRKAVPVSRMRKKELLELKEDGESFEEWKEEENSFEEYKED